MAELTRGRARTGAGRPARLLRCIPSTPRCVIWTMFDGTLAVPSGCWSAWARSLRTGGATRSPTSSVRRCPDRPRATSSCAELGPLATRGYTVMQDVDLGRGVADVLVVGPSGIYAIACSAWPGGSRSRGRSSRAPVCRRSGSADARPRPADLVERRLALQGLDGTATPVIVLTRGHSCAGRSLCGA